MMIPEMWRAPLFNHLWQSTVILGLAWIATVLLKRNPARVRYGIWMLASLKFLIPLSLLVRLGEHWARPIAGKAVGSSLYTTADEIGQPFETSFVSAANSSHGAESWITYIPAVLAAMWLCGLTAVLVTWLARWARMARIARRARPMEEGPEFEALGQAAANAGLRRAIPLRASTCAMEPGVFGIIRPVLLWPAGISAQLDEGQIASIMAHEVEHVRRHDNLTSAMHMLVQALFWFHPAVHWMSARLLEERERACDEKVLELSGRPETYAESILKVCAFCLEPPVACVSGVSGSDLKQRILRIMTQPSGVALSALRKMLLCAAGLGIVGAPLGFGMLHAMQAPTELVHAPEGTAPQFDVVSIKPSPNTGEDLRLIGMSPTGFTAKHASLKEMIGMAYGLTGDDQLVGGPSWMSSEYFDVETKESEGDIEAGKKLTMEQRRTQFSWMLQSMLADRFGLKTTIEKRELPVFALVVAKGGIKMKQVQPDPLPPPGTPPSPGAHLPRLMKTGAQWTATAFPIGQITHWLSRFEELNNHVVVNETGLAGNYDFVLNGVSMGSQFEPKHEASDEPSMSIFTALQDQLGLKLEPRKAPVEVVIVQQAQRPSPN